MVRSCTRLSIVCTLVVMGCATMMACGDNNENNAPPGPTDDMVGMDMAADLPVDMPDLGTFDQTPSCDPLVLTPQMAYATTHQLISFDASGGSGALRFELKENLSGAIINDLTGAYLAGLSPGVTDVVRLVDDVCKTDLEATVAVVESMEVSPREIELKPGQSFTFEIGKGSGEFTYAFISNISGASVTAQGVYTAGNKAGKDRVEVIDARTGESVEATVTVSPDVVFEAMPAQVVVPVGQQYAIQTRGGSNVVDVTVQGNMVSVSDGTLTIKGEKRTENEVKEEDYHRSERSYGKFVRTIGFPSSVDAEKIEASYGDGVLEIALPKVAEIKPKRITLKTRNGDKPEK